MREYFPNRTQWKNLLLKDEEFAKFAYCDSFIGYALVRLKMLEETLLFLVWMANEEKQLQKNNGTENLAEIVLKFQRCTFGQLVNQIEDLGIRDRDIRYLKAIVEVRNRFVHRDGEYLPTETYFEKFNYEPEFLAKTYWKVANRFEFTEHIIRKILSDAGHIKVVTVSE